VSDTSSPATPSSPEFRSKRRFLRAASLATLLLGGAAAARASAATGTSTGTSTGPQPAPNPGGLDTILTFQSLLRGEQRVTGDLVQSLGFHHLGDGGGGLYRRHASQLFKDSFQSAAGDWWSLVPTSSHLNVRQFGAAGDGRRDDSAAIETAVRCFRRLRAAVLYFPAGDYRLRQPVLHYDQPEDLGNIRILGDGPELTRFVLDGPFEEFLFRVQGDTSAYGKRHVRFVDFENFGILGNGRDRQNLFSLTCADRTNLRNIHAYDFVGTGIRGRQWWDSLCDIRFVKGGDSDPGRETPVVDLDFVFEERLTDSACNNIVFPETCQIEAYRWQAMRWGRSTRRCRFLGKVHGWIGRDYQVPGVHLQGATSNLFFGCSLAHSMGSDQLQRDLVIENTDYIPSHNRIMACSFVNGVELIGDTRGNLISDCVFRNKSGPAVLVDRGRGNIIRDNIGEPDQPLLKAADPRALAPLSP
jgi:hypothetical protein